MAGLAIEQHATRRSLQESEERFRNLVETANVVPWEYDLLNNRLLYIRPQIEQRLGYPTEKWLEKQFWRDIVHADGGRRAAELTEQTLAYTDRVRIEATIVDLADLVREMARLLMTTISKKIRLSYDGPQDLATAAVDATQVRQVVMNLITNAAEAIGDKEGLIRITTGVMEADAAYLEDNCSGGEDLTPGRFAWLEVSDNGRGMHQDTQARIFDPFFTTRFTGRGLGLAALLGIVKQHGGAVKVQSQVRVGTTLRVLFPFAEISTNSAEVELPAIDTRKGLPGRGCSVLLADDEKGARMVATAIPRQAGFSVSTARDGHETVASFERGRDRFALVLLDMKMPGLGGEEVVPKLRAIRPDIPVLVCSGYTEDETKDRFLRDEVEGS